MTSTTIGIAIVEHEGRFLVGWRSDDQVLAGHAEFPGGKCEPDEEPAACAIRECLEETGLPVTPVEQLNHCEFTYPHGTVDLHFWLCHLAPGVDSEKITLASQSGFRWVPREELSRLDFPDANREVIRQLSRQA